MWALNELNVYKVSDTIFGKSQCPGTVRAHLCCFPFYILTVNYTLYIVLGGGGGRVEVKYYVHELCSRICGGDCYTSQE